MWKRAALSAVLTAWMQLTLAAAPAGAQIQASSEWQATAFDPPPSPTALRGFRGGVDSLRGPGSEASIDRLAIGGLLGAAGGLAAGAALGYAIETSASCGGDEWCGLAGGILGAIAGEMLGLPLGVHVASKGQGDLGGALFFSAAVGGLGLLVGTATGGTLIPLVPIAQLLAVIPLYR